MDLDRLKIDRGTRKRRRSNTRWLRLGITLAVLVAAVWLLRRPLGRIYDRLTLPVVEVARAVKSNPLEATAVSGTAANGYIVANRRAALSADTPGRVVELNVEEGSVVKKGDLVARLYDDEYRAALRRADAELAVADAAVNTAQAELKAAQSRLATQKNNVDAANARIEDTDAQVTLAELEHERAKELINTGAGTQQELDEAKAKLDRAHAARRTEGALLAFASARVTEADANVTVATATVEEAQTRVATRRATRDEAKATLAKTEVRAPFDGVVVLKDAEVGEVVSPNSQGGNSRGSIVTMVDFKSLQVQVDMPERTLAAVKLEAPAYIYLDAYPDVRYTGVVQRIWPTANRQKGTVELRIGFDEPDGRLRPEMGVRVVFSPAEAAAGPEAPTEPVVMVPNDCVTRIDGRTGVFLLERDVAQFRVVELGEKRGRRVIVKAGLSGGESLVQSPPADLRDGERVRVQQ